MNHTQSKRKKKTAPWVVYLFNLYLVIVAISAVIVGTFLLWKVFVPAPTVSDPVTTPPTIVTPTPIPEPDTTDPEPEPESNPEPEPEPLPVLERREGVYNILLVGCDDGNGNADTMMVASYDSKATTCNLVSIPRDTIISRSWSKFPKLNAAYGAGGAELVGKEISYTLGIPIDYYVTVDLSAFEDLVNEVGGIDFNVPEDMYHDDEGGFIIDLKAGQQHLNGNQTLQLVRYRGYLNADIGRTHVQQQVLKALVKKALSWNSLVSVNNFVEIFNAKVDTNLSLTDMLYLAQTAIAIDLSTGVTTQTLEGRGDGVKNGTQWCYELDKEKALETVNEALNPFTTDLDERYMNIASADSYLQ